MLATIMGIGTQEMFFILVIALFLFGGKKLPELARGLGRGIREFKDASDDIKREISDQINNFERDLDLEVDSKPASAKEVTKADVVAQEINTHSQTGQTEHTGENASSATTESSLPKFGPPAGTYEHNPNSLDDKTELEEQYYQYGYKDHFDTQNEADYTPAPEDEVQQEPAVQQSDDNEQPSKDA